MAGECYLVGKSPTGAWSDRADHLAAFGAGGWRYVPPVTGMSFVVKTTGASATYGSAGWEVGTVRGARLMIDGLQVIGSQAPAIAGPAGGSTVDAEARGALEQVLEAMRAHGLIAL